MTRSCDEVFSNVNQETVFFMIFLHQIHGLLPQFKGLQSTWMEVTMINPSVSIAVRTSITRFRLFQDSIMLHHHLHLILSDEFLKTLACQVSHLMVLEKSLQLQDKKSSDINV